MLERSSCVNQRVRLFALAASALIAVAASAACSDAGDSTPGSPTTPTAVTATATATSDSPRGPAIVDPPEATLRTAGGRSVVAGVGTRCWGNVCLDAVGPVTNVDPFPLTRGEAVTLSFAAGSPDERHDTAYRVASDAGSRVLADGRLWQALGARTQPPETTLPPDLAPGSYVWVVQGFWKDKGDVSYGFYVEIR
jgi:hypothetical protein